MAAESSFRRFVAAAGVALLSTSWPLAFPRQKPVTSPQSGRDAAAMPAQPQGTGAITGTLVSANTGRPVRRARVAVSSIDPRYGRSVSTDDDGRF